MDLNSIKDAFDRVTKKQKISSSKTQEVIDHLGRELEQALAKVPSSNDFSSACNHKSILTECKTKLQDVSLLRQLEGTQRELNIALSKYQKLLEKSFNSDISKAYRDVNFDSHIVDQVIVSHLYRQGMFDIHDCFIGEARELEAALTEPAFLEMHLLLAGITARNLEPALNWAAMNCDRLKQNGSDLELKLHRLQFLEILQKGSRDEALKYARNYLSPLACNHMAEIQKLMACLLWTGNLDCSPYSEVASQTHWDELAVELTRQFCDLLGQSHQSPLSLTIAAGGQALPPLLKMVNVMAGKKEELLSMNQELAVPVDLDREFQFHSIFVCPVTREQATEENPPMLMLCGHVLCKQSIMKMSKSYTRSFKCPYCPTDVDAGRCRRLYF